MLRNSTRPRRLRVSALAAVANPSFQRIDTWHLLDDAAKQLAAVDRAGGNPRWRSASLPRLAPRPNVAARGPAQARTAHCRGGREALDLKLSSDNRLQRARRRSSFQRPLKSARLFYDGILLQRPDFIFAYSPVGQATGKIGPGNHGAR